jgi:hypothetical protein
MEVLKDIVKWAVYCGPLIVALAWVWIACDFHRYISHLEKNRGLK